MDELLTTIVPAIDSLNTFTAGIKMNNIIPFSFETLQVRVAMIDGDPWFYVTDVCAALQLTNPSMALKALDDDEKRQVIDSSTLSSTEGGEINSLRNVINESGLYTLILRCRDATKPGAVPHKFRKWVTSEVLPPSVKLVNTNLKKSHLRQTAPSWNSRTSCARQPKRTLRGRLLLGCLRMSGVPPGSSRDFLDNLTDRSSR